MAVRSDAADQSRFANLSTSELFQREAEASAELDAINEALRARLIAESNIVLGCVYDIVGDAAGNSRRCPYLGRKIRVCALQLRKRWGNNHPPWLEVHGHLAWKGTPATQREHFGIRPVVVKVRDLKIESHEVT